tara:strand:- start:844 stop:1080 length:237 start_codon:yes stop_codon:yes gene_type:complete
MSRTISGSKNNIPGGLEPLEWANEVWSVMDERGVSQNDAKVIVAARYRRIAAYVNAIAKAREQPPRDKMVTTSSNKGI